MGHGACSNFGNDVARGISQCGGSPLIKAMRRGSCDPTSVRSTVGPNPTNQDSVQKFAAQLLDTRYVYWAHDGVNSMYYGAETRDLIDWSLDDALSFCHELWFSDVSYWMCVYSWFLLLPRSKSHIHLYTGVRLEYHCYNDRTPHYVKYTTWQQKKNELLGTRLTLKCKN
jgi:hypothetical protein